MLLCQVQQNLKDYRQALRDLPSNYTTTDGKSLEENLSNLTLLEDNKEKLKNGNISN